MQGDPEVARTVENELMLYRAGWEDALRTHPPCHHTHPAIAASVAEMFAGWDGAAAAQVRPAVPAPSGTSALASTSALAVPMTPPKITNSPAFFPVSDAVRNNK